MLSHRRHRPIVLVVLVLMDGLPGMICTLRAHLIDFNDDEPEW